MKYKKRSTDHERVVEAVRLTSDCASVRGHLCWLPAVSGHWLVVSPTSQRFVSDSEFRREFEEVKAPTPEPTYRDNPWGPHPAGAPFTTFDGRAVERIGVDPSTSGGGCNVYADGTSHQWSESDCNRRDSFNGGWWCERRGDEEVNTITRCTSQVGHNWYAPFCLGRPTVCRNCGIER